MFGGTALTLIVYAFLAVLFVILARSAWEGIACLRPLGGRWLFSVVSPTLP